MQKVYVLSHGPESYSSYGFITDLSLESVYKLLEAKEKDSIDVIIKDSIIINSEALTVSYKVNDGMFDYENHYEFEVIEKVKG